MNTSKSLKKILKKTVSVLDESKKDIFAIAESSRQEYEKIRKELETVKEETNQVIDAVDDLETVNRKARLRLMEVSKDFYNYTEKDIQNAYEKAQETSVEIAVLKEKEEQLKEKRNYLEKRLIKIKKNVERAENLVSRVSIIRQFLIGEMDSLNNHF
ncbi:MAG: histidine kinase, partial [Halanaerobiales bacterium]